MCKLEFYKFDVDGKHEYLQPIIDDSYNKIRKRIGKEIFQTLGIFGGEDKYYLAKRIYRNMFIEDDPYNFVNIGLKDALLTTASSMIDYTIQNEYKLILELQHKIIQLESELNFYTTLQSKGNDFDKLSNTF